MNNAKKYTKTTEWERLGISSSTLAISRDYFIQSNKAKEIKGHTVKILKLWDTIQMGTGLNG